MSRPEPPPRPGRGAGGPHYGRYVGALGIAILVFITINTIVTKPNGATGIPPGGAAAPFAVPLVQSTLNGAAQSFPISVTEGGTSLTSLTAHSLIS